MWEEELFCWDSPNLKFPARIQTPKPYQDPHPPVWQAAATEKSAVTAGELGLGLLHLSLVQPVEKMADTIQVYRAARPARPEEMLTRVKNDRVGAYTLVHCYDDPDEAAAYGLWESVNWWYRTWPSSRSSGSWPRSATRRRPRCSRYLEAVINGEVPIEKYQEEDMIIIGTPEECLRKILRYEEAGVDQLLCYVQFGDLPHDKVMRGLELLAKEVIPKFEERGHRVGATVSV